MEYSGATRLGMGGGRLIERWVVPWSSLEPTLGYSGATTLGMHGGGMAGLANMYEYMVNLPKRFFNLHKVSFITELWCGG